jgi:hypothetical protein
MGLSDFHPRPARTLTDRQLHGPLPAHGNGSPVLTRQSLARMSTPLPRRLDPVRGLLASRTNDGLRPFIAGSALALAVSRPARRSLMFQPACSLIPSRDLLHQRLRPGPLPTRAAPVASGWSNSCRVGYLPPTGSTRPFHGALQISLSVCFCRASGFAGFKRPGPRPKFGARRLVSRPAF